MPEVGEQRQLDLDRMFVSMCCGVEFQPGNCGRQPPGQFRVGSHLAAGDRPSLVWRDGPGHSLPRVFWRENHHARRDRNPAKDLCRNVPRVPQARVRDEHGRPPLGRPNIATGSAALLDGGLQLGGVRRDRTCPPLPRHASAVQPADGAGWSWKTRDNCSRPPGCRFPPRGAFSELQIGRLSTATAPRRSGGRRKSMRNGLVP